MEFDWDDLKDKANIQKHNISFSESVETFYDPNGIRLIDSEHSYTEDRFFWIGKTKHGKVLTTWFTERDGKIRIIGCAQWRKFRKHYYETTKIK